MSSTFGLGDVITVRTAAGRTATGRIVEIVIPADGAPGYRREFKNVAFSGYSGGYCHEHQRPVTADEVPIAPTLPHYTILTSDRRGIERCQCQVVTESKAVSLW